MASENGKKFECDAARLSSNMCYFVATAENDIGGAYPHNINPCNEHGYRKVVDSNKTDLPVTPKPWQTGDTLAASETEVTGDLLLYTKAFEMMAPLRDLMMYEPEVLKEDKDLWVFLTQPLKDCSVKDDDEQGDHGTAYSRDHVYEILKDNKGKDSHHNILQFLEEGVIDLVCAMTSENSLPDFPRCQNVRERSSSCWEEAYAALQEETCGDDSSPSPEPPVPEPTPETTRSAPVPEPMPETTRSSPAPAPPAPAPPAPAPEPPVPAPTRRSRPKRNNRPKRNGR